MLTTPADLDQYMVNAPPYPGPSGEQTRPHARANFDPYMAAKDQRRQAMRDLLHDDELSPGMFDTKVQALAD